MPRLHLNTNSRGSFRFCMNISTKHLLIRCNCGNCSWKALNFNLYSFLFLGLIKWLHFPCQVSWGDVIHWMWPLFTEDWGSWRSESLNLSPIPFTVETSCSEFISFCNLRFSKVEIYPQILVGPSDFSPVASFP